MEVVMEDEELNAGEAAAFLGITRQAIHWAKNKRRIRFRFNSYGRILIKKSVLIAYIKGKHERYLTTMINGTRVYKKHNGRLPVKDAAELADIPRQNLYYAIRHGDIPYEVVGSQYVLRIKDIEKYAISYWGIKKENQLA